MSHGIGYDVHNGPIGSHFHGNHLTPSEHRFMYVPFASKGTASYRDTDAYNQVGFPGTPRSEINAIQLGRVITFNQPIPRNIVHEFPIASVDVQKRVELFDLKDETEQYMNHTMLEEIPNIDYIVIKTAMYHSYGSPVASGRAMDLQDQAQKLLSSMRDNDSMKTTPDIIFSPPLHYIEV